MGKLIAQTRKDLGCTQQQIAERTGIVKTTLSKIENGRFTGSIDIFERYLEAVGLQIQLEPRHHTLPKWDEIDALFEGDD